MNDVVLRNIWQTLQPDWPTVVLNGSIILLLLTLLGFLVAALLLRRKNERKAKRWSKYEREWGALVAEVVSERASSAEARSSIGPGEELVFVDFLYKQALRTTDSAQRAVLLRLAAPHLPRIESRTRGADAERRARAVRTLAELGSEREMLTVAAALDDPSPLVAMSAARALALRGDIGHAREIVDRLGRFGDWNSRFLRATLVQLGSSVGPALRASARNTQLPPRVRAVCIEVLGDIADPEAASLAGELLSVEENVDLLAASLRVIRRCGDGSSAHLVLPLCWDANPIIRAHAVGTFATITSEGDVELEGALEDPSPWVALQAARGLKHRGRTHVLERAATARVPSGLNDAVALQVLMEES